jgi:hypothetical protein
MRGVIVKQFWERCRAAILIPVFAALVCVHAGERAIRAAQTQDAAHASLAHQQPSSGPALARGEPSLAVKVLSEDGVPVDSAQIILTQASTSRIFKAETDYSGRFTFTELQPGLYKLQVAKEGFYTTAAPEVHVGETKSVKVALDHERKLTKSVKVVYTPPLLDPSETASQSSLNSREIIDLPYPVPRDVRYALALLPGVVQDADSQLHVDGSRASELFDQLDGFDITDPITDEFNIRLAPEALREASVEDSRYPAEYGNASGGILILQSSMGDDHYRFSGVNFIPSIQDQHGLRLDNWTPRLTFSGPIDKGKAWFLDSFDGEYDLAIIDGLPPGEDEDPVLEISNLARTEVNLTSSNILTTDFLINRFHAPRDGISLFTPSPSTVNTTENSYLLTAKDQMFLHNGALIEWGLGATSLHHANLPWGDEPYVVYPGSVSGNYFEASRDHASRIEEIANAYLPAFHWLGQHQLQFGTDNYQITYDRFATFDPYLIEGKNRSLLRRVTFSGPSDFSTRNFDVGSYVQDRWSVLPRLLIEPGVRFDWDTTVHDALFSPRLALTFVPRERSQTELFGGVGLYNQATNLSLITQPFGGERLDYFYDPTGQFPIGPPVRTSFRLQPDLRQPRVWNWSAGVEHMFRYSFDVRTEFVEKRERYGWAYFNLEPFEPGAISGRYELRDDGADRYDAAEITLRRRFRRGDTILVSYTRSAARSNAVMDFDLENPVFAQQEGGPLPWDAPNRLVSWGLVPLWKGFNLAYTLDWRTGFPFSVFNQNQELVQSPDSYRFPAYFSQDAAIERRVSLLGFRWDLRAGLNDLTGRRNPFAVNDNIDSPGFLTYSSLQGRTLEAQFRLLGRK